MHTAAGNKNSVTELDEREFAEIQHVNRVRCSGKKSKQNWESIEDDKEKVDSDYCLY